MTITKYHIELYKKVGGDVDHLQRIGTSKEKSIANQSIIVEMEELVSNLELIKKGITSNQYKEEINAKLNKLCVDDSIIAEIKKLKSFR
jgi:CRISPR/Cas system Type II protein with McrA/HNH and RuvC-like nuclease domain